ncbi:MAG TPA: hypothetical protein PLU36_01035 [Chitinophagaceae bacterium]|nr:hypothetical protein [Chitinophagaceae bacterium]MCC6635093.1 hypothetical protein [Chitinophagaceae bacterium]HMZ45364.1 hypothetical protein [Chitinophagaceae bacterium]HNJ57474.1 hypothetical protein [Chitinophagaceae bacterium]HNM34407.1 hypothetical protein [Chitinophagaceae bacterium]
MKKIIVCFGWLLLVLNSNAQRGEVKELGFKKQNVFIGGSLTLGYGNVSNSYGGGSNFVIGANPEIGYSLAEWIDVGTVFNIIYSSTRFNDYTYRYRQTGLNTGVGAFIRLYPIPSFFLLAQPEHNWIKVTQTNLDQPGVPKITQKVQASSFLVGVGYGQRIIGSSSFFTTIMFDLGKEIYSPYRDGFNNAIPIVRTGFNWYLNSAKKKKK